MGSLVVQIIILSLFTVLLTFLLFLFPGKDDGDATRAQILVLGDIARSPRMRNHALSLARHGIRVDLIGYVDSNVPVELERHHGIKVRGLPTPPRILQAGGSGMFTLLGPLKVIFQVVSLVRVLFFGVNHSKWLFVQNPPSIPTLAVAALVCYFRGTKLVIDWHNYGYSILALKLGQGHLLVQISYMYEKYFSSFATMNFTVSEAMRKQLQKGSGLSAPLVTLYDRPTPPFAPVAPSKRMEILKTIVPEAQWDLLERGRLKCIASSTSWTPDEDFSVLLDALVAYSALAMGSKPSLPELFVVITGKGLQKAEYQRKIVDLDIEGKMEMISIQTPWFQAVTDYAQLLGAVDLGVSLHTSSSGVDLPMKVVDMLGAGIPVAGWSKYESWPELVQEGENGRGFQSSEELLDVLVDLMGDDGSKLAELKGHAMKESKHSWEEEWDKTAGRLLGLSE